MTNPSIAKGRVRVTGSKSRQGEDHLEDVASYIPSVPHQLRLGESSRMQGDANSRHARVSQPMRFCQQGHKVATPASTPAPCANPAFFAQIARVVIEGKSSASTLSALVATKLIDNIVTLVKIIQSIREMHCESYLEELDAEIIVRWLHKVEKTMDYIRVSDELLVDCATQLLSDITQSWWDIISSRRVIKALSWNDFKVEFEDQFCS